MTIAVIAANGRTGREVVSLALSKGYKVKAGVRGQYEFPVDENLTVYECDATKKQDILELISGSDAVISVIGHVRGSQSNLQTKSITNCIDVMEKLEIQRIVSLTGTGVRFPGDEIKFIDRLLNYVISKIDPKRINDGVQHTEVLRKSKTDWTLVRVLKLGSGRLTNYQLKINGPAKTFVSRKTVADAMIKVIEEDIFITEAPIVSS